MRIYDYMKGILGAMGVGEDVGVPEPSWRIEEYLKAIYDKLKEGGGLPSVTSADNGKVLAVKDGAWAAQNDFVVTLSINPETFPNELDADKSSTEIQTAYLQGKRLVLALPITEEEVYYAFPELRYTYETGQKGTRYSFGAIMSAGSFGTYYIQTDANTGVEFVTAFTLIPAS